MSGYWGCGVYLLLQLILTYLYNIVTKLMNECTGQCWSPAMCPWTNPSQRGLDITFRRSSFRCSSPWVDEHKAPTIMLMYSSVLMTESCSKMLSEAPRYHSSSRKILMKGTMPWSFRTTADQTDSMGYSERGFCTSVPIIRKLFLTISKFVFAIFLCVSFGHYNFFQSLYTLLKWEEEKRNCTAEN